MQKELGVKPKKDKSEKKRDKEERKRLKHERKHRKERDSRSPGLSHRKIDREHSPLPDDYHRRYRSRSPRRLSPSRSRSPGPSRRRDEDPRDYHRYPRDPVARRGRSISRSPRRSSRTDSEERYHAGPSTSKHEAVRPSRYSPPRDMDYGKRSRSPSSRRRSPPPKRIRSERSPPPSRPYHAPPSRPYNDNGNNSRVNAEEDRAARLAAMSSNANSMSEDRQKRLAALLEKEKAEMEADERARAKSGGMSGFLSQEQKRVFGGMGGLEDRIKRGRGGLVVDAD